MTYSELHETLARRAAARYKRKCWWASIDDLRQQARLAVLDAARSWDPTVGVPFDGYAWRAVMNQLSALVLRDSAPVSAPQKKLMDLRGLYRAVLDPSIKATGPPVDEALARAEWIARARRALEDVLAEERDHQIARDVLLAGLRPRSVALVHGVPVSHVYRVVHRVRVRIADSYECWRLWQEQEH